MTTNDRLPPRPAPRKVRKGKAKPAKPPKVARPRGTASTTNPSPPAGARRRAPATTGIPRPKPLDVEPTRPFGLSEVFIAAVAGALAGFTAAGLYYLAGVGCLWLRGPGGCGGIGLFSTIVLLLVSGLVGAAPLWLLRQRDPFATSYLGIGLLAIAVMLSVMRQLDNAWMIAVIPTLSAGCYMVSWWLTSIIVRESS
ncbi:MAG TPA: hypothetical protein P5108_10895 [Marmoricola sp.]|nr:hypothetical protein [Marmoricola sp.]